MVWQLNIDFKLLLSLVIGVFMGALDMTILAPALPHLSTSFDVTPGAVVLVFSLYAVCYAVSVPLISKLSDVRGYRLVYGVSMALFATGSAVAALAPSLPVLLGARAVQGIGGGGLFPVAQALVGATLPDEKRGKVLGILLGTFALGGVLGPNLGGYLVQHFIWHWIFWINVPLGLLGALLLVNIDLPSERRETFIDWTGAALVAVTFGSFVLGIEGLRDLHRTGFFSLRIGLPLALTVLGGCLLTPIERRTKDPILDLNLITSPAIAPLLLASMLVGYALLSGVVFVPIYVQVQFGTSVLGSGAVLNAAAAGLGLSSWIAGAYTNRVGGKRLVIAGMASTTIGLGLMIALHGTLWGLLGGLALLGAGLGLAQGPITYLGLALAPAKDHGQISGLISITRSMGGATGMTVSGVLLSEASRSLARHLSTKNFANLGTQAWGSSSGLTALREAPAAVQETVRETLGSGIMEGWYWAAGAALLGLLLSFALKDRRPSNAENSSEFGS